MINDTDDADVGAFEPAALDVDGPDNDEDVKDA
jgi:hypothetical protein